MEEASDWPLGENRSLLEPAKKAVRRMKREKRAKADEAVGFISVVTYHPVAASSALRRGDKALSGRLTLA
jgi:hypothetical protein